MSFSCFATPPSCEKTGFWLVPAEHSCFVALVLSSSVRKRIFFEKNLNSNARDGSAVDSYMWKIGAVYFLECWLHSRGKSSPCRLTPASSCKVGRASSCTDDVRIVGALSGSALQ